MIKQRPLHLLALSLLGCAISSGAYAECPESICSGESVNVEEVAQKIEENKSAFKEAKDNAIDEYIGNMFPNKEELPGKECLDGLIGLDITATFTDFTTGYPNLLAALTDQIINAGCQAAVEYANKKIAEANQSINETTAGIAEDTGGFFAIESKTNRDGEISYNNKVQTISELGEKNNWNEKWNEEFNHAVYGDPYGSGIKRDSDIDLSSERYHDPNSAWSGESDIAGDHKSTFDAGAAGQSAIDNAACWLSKDC